MDQHLDTIPDQHLAGNDTDDTQDISRAELEAVVDDSLTPREAALWRLMHSHEAGRCHLRSMCLRVGYPDSTSNSDASGYARNVIGKVEARGVSRARAFQVMTGFNRDRVSILLSQYCDDDDPKTALKALDISARCLGMGATPAGNVTVNVGVQVLSGHAGRLLRDALADEPTVTIDAAAEDVPE